MLAFSPWACFFPSWSLVSHWVFCPICHHQQHIIGCVLLFSVVEVAYFLFDCLFTIPEVLMALNSVAAVLCCSWLVEDIWHKYGFHFQLEVRPPLSGAASVLSLLSDMFIVALSSARYTFVIAVIFGRRLVNRCIKMPSSYLSTLLNFP